MLDVDEKQKCFVLTLSVGSYMKTVFPLLNQWKNLTQETQINSLTVKLVSLVPGHDENGKHVDTLVTFIVNSKKVTITCYNPTQRLKVEGPGYEIFVRKYLLNTLEKMMATVPNEIETYNKGVIAVLTGKRKLEIVT